MGKEKTVKKKEPVITAFIYGVDENPSWFDERINEGTIHVEKDECKIIKGIEMGHTTKTEVIAEVESVVTENKPYPVFSQCTKGDYIVRELLPSGDENITVYSSDEYATLFEDTI